jgi:hypothetical protein
VSTHAEDRSLQKILWRKSSEEPIKEYELTTVSYGTAPAAFLATRCLQQLALEESERFPKAAEALCSSFYVDDFLGGCSTPEEAIELREQLSSLLSNGGFPLWKWCSNNTAVLESILLQKREKLFCPARLLMKDLSRRQASFGIRRLINSNFRLR